MPSEDNFTPALGYHWLSPLYDGAIALMTRERRWRGALLEQVAPRPDERILDVGCGTGTMTIMLKRAEPAAEIIGLDPDDAILARATRKAALARIDVGFLRGFLDAATAARIGPVDQITCSLVLHQIPIEGKKRLLATAHGLLRQNGTLHVVDYGLQRTVLMRTAFRLIQLLDGFENTGHNARGILPRLMEEAGFTKVEETRVLATVTGSVSMYRARP